jgi:hypothetical protein
MAKQTPRGSMRTAPSIAVTRSCSSAVSGVREARGFAIRVIKNDLQSHLPQLIERQPYQAFILSQVRR